MSVQEYLGSATIPAVEYVRGSDYGGGIGGVLYTIRGADRSYNAYNSRGDVVSKTNDASAITWQAAYEAFGTRTQEEGTTLDRQKANTKDEDPTGLLNEGFRYRDLEFGIFLTRDPLGFVDGPNDYTYVRQNPWTFYDPYGLESHGQVVDSIWNFGGGVGRGVGGAVYGAKEAFGYVVGGALNAGGAAFGHQGSKELGADKLQTAADTAAGLKHAVTNPVSTGKAVVADYKEKLGSSEGAGEVVGEIGAGIATGAFLKVASKASKIGGATSREIAETGSLYRVVDDVELADIKDSGSFRPFGTFDEGKQFVDNLSDAEALREKFEKFWGGNQTVVPARAPQTVIDNSHRAPFADIPKGEAITVTPKNLPSVKPEQ